MLTSKKDRYPNVGHIIRIILILPVSTAHVERQFSCMKRIMGDWRLGLENPTIEHLLRISTEGPDAAEFNPSKAVERWRLSGKRSRRPESHPYGPRKKVEKTVQNAVESSASPNQVDTAECQLTESQPTDSEIDNVRILKILIQIVLFILILIIKVIKNGSCTAGIKLSTYVLYNVISWSLNCSDDTCKYP